MRYYAGIGARMTPTDVLNQMRNIAVQLALRGWALRSGGAKGADTAFEQATKLVGGYKMIRCATLHKPLMEHAAMFHPAWDKLDLTAQALHARNSAIMLGDWLDDPVSFVVCWTPDAAIKGGTGQALRIAGAYGVPVFNLAEAGAESRLWEHLSC